MRSFFKGERIRLMLFMALFIFSTCGYSKPVLKSSVYVYSLVELSSSKGRAEFRMNFTINKHVGTKKINNLLLLSCARTTLSHGYKYFRIKSQKKSWNYKDKTIKVIMECFRQRPLRKGLGVYDARKLAMDTGQ